MLKDFWKKKKTSLEIVGILIGIGALFLNISLPNDNDMARQALFNIHIVWLTIISLAMIFLFINFWIFAIQLESKSEKKTKWDLGGALSLLIVYIAIFFLSNLWKYTLFIYRDSLKQLLEQVSLAGGVFLFSLFIFIRLKIVKYYQKNIFRYFLFLIILPIIFSIAHFFLIGLVDLKLDFNKFYKLFSLYSLFYLLLSCGFSIFRDRKYKHKKIKKKK